MHQIAENAADGEKQGADDGQRSSDASHGDTYLRLRQGKRSARALRLAPAQG
jgi:hypothetical protein